MVRILFGLFRGRKRKRKNGQNYWFGSLHAFCRKTRKHSVNDHVLNENLVKTVSGKWDGTYTLSNSNPPMYLLNVHEGYGHGVKFACYKR